MASSREKEEVYLEGMGISEGIAVGTLFFLKPHEGLSVPQFPIAFSEVDKEIQRYRRALASSRKDLERLQLFLQKEGADEAVSIIDAHIQMLDDPFLTIGMEEKIALMLENTESVFFKVISEYKTRFLRMQESEVQQRLIDVQDLSSRILKHLHPASGRKEVTIPAESILCTYELIPTQTAEASQIHIHAFVTEIGGITSHVALIARSKGIPYISNISMEGLQEEGKVPAIVDGTEGLLILYPTPESVEEYSGKKGEKTFFVSGEDLPSEPRTTDGVPIEVQANLENLADIDLLKEYNVRAIGLVRSEFIYLRRNIESFQEEEQFSLYKKLILMAGNIDVTFRVFDIGSDKKFFRSNVYEPNPALGCRSIRFLLENPKLFSSQIRAILRAAIHGKVKLLLPLVTDLEELREAKEFIERERAKLIGEGFEVPDTLQIGCMVEVPAFVIMCDHIVKECDFLSIGTNDLIQYTLVADRTNAKTSHRYSPLHPSIIRLIKHVRDIAHYQNIPVSICGEIASDVRYTKLLIGLGIRILSCAPRFIPHLKQTIAKIHAGEAKALADHILSLPTSEEVQAHLELCR